MEEMMLRREFMAAVGTTAAVVAAQHAFAQAPAAAPAAFEPPMHPAQYKALEDVAGECVETGEDCLRHCFGMLAMKDTSMAACAEKVYELIAACRALRTLAAANSKHVPIFAKAVEQVCIDCKKECDKFPKIAECHACGAACAKCAEECRKLI
jgi:Cys-rich four helix bundle protein (predicted Tat secretion target)